MLRRLKSKDLPNFKFFVLEHALNNLNFKDLLNGKMLAFISEENNIINGLLFVEKKDKSYLNVISSSKKITNNLLKIFFWNWDKEVYSLIHEDNKIGFILKKNNFRIIGKTDKTFLLYYNPKEKRLKYGKHN